MVTAPEWAGCLLVLDAKNGSKSILLICSGESGYGHAHAGQGLERPLVDQYDQRGIQDSPRPCGRSQSLDDAYRGLRPAGCQVFRATPDLISGVQNLDTV